MRKRAWTRRSTGLLLLVLTAVWATALPVPFLGDDFADVVDNPAAKAESFLDRLGLTLRALLKASYALQDWLHGAWAPGFHIVNILLHVASAMIALALLRKLCRQAGLGEGVAIMATALWALHPALTASVTLVAGRSAVLSGLLLLGSFSLAIGPPTNGRRLAAGLLAFLAPLARETALILPALLICWQMTLGQKEGAALRRALPVVLGSLAAAGIILAMPRHRELIEFSLEARQPLEALRDNIQALPAILRYLFLPWEVTIDPAQPPPRAWGESQVLLPLAGLAVLLLAVLFLRLRHPLWAFAIGWTFLCLLPSNSLLWRDEPVGLRPLYLSGLGPALLLGIVLARHCLGRLLAVFLACALATMTVAYNRLSADPVALWQDASEKAPGKARPLIELGIALMDEGCLDQAQAALKGGLARQPGNLAALRAMERLTLLYQVNPPLVCDRS